MSATCTCILAWQRAIYCTFPPVLSQCNIWGKDIKTLAVETWYTDLLIVNNEGYHLFHSFVNGRLDFIAATSKVRFYLFDLNWFYSFDLNWFYLFDLNRFYSFDLNQFYSFDLKSSILLLQPLRSQQVNSLFLIQGRAWSFQSLYLPTCVEYTDNEFSGLDCFSACAMLLRV